MRIACALFTMLQTYMEMPVRGSKSDQDEHNNNGYYRVSHSIRYYALCNETRDTDVSISLL